MLIFMDGFDHYATNDVLKKWDFTTGDSTISGTTPRRVGTKYLETKGLTAGAGIGRRFDEFGPTIVFGFAYFQYIGSINTPSTGAIFTRSASNVIRLYISDAGELNLICGGVNVISVANVILGSTWQYIECKVFLHGTTGTYEVKVSGTTVLSGSGVDTLATYDTVDYLSLSHGFNRTIRWDDLYICDGTGGVNDDFLGDCRIDCLYPDGETADIDFTPFPVVARNLNVDDPGDIDDDTTYNESNFVGDLDAYTLGAIDALGTTIHGIAQNSCMKKTDADSRYVKQYTKSGATITLGDEIYLTDTYKVWQTLYDVNPDDSAAFEEADLNALESGVKVTA